MKHSTELTIRPEQTSWTPAQQKTLEHMGVAGIGQADLDVFFHVVRRTGLDPFARQIHCIARQVSEKDENGNWVKKTKWTIQTGIDGFRLIGHRASGSVSVDAAEWLHVPSYIAEMVADHPRRAAAVRGDWAKLKFWGLIEEKPDVRDDGSPRVGYWRMTPLGRQFVCLRFGDGLAGVAVLVQQRLRRRLACSPVTTTLPSRDDEDRAVQAAFVQTLHSDSPWSTDERDKGGSGNSRW